MKGFIILTILSVAVLVKGDKKYYVIPQEIGDCDPSIKIFNSEYQKTLEKVGPHHVAINFPHFVLTKVIQEPIKVTAVVEKHKSDDKWNFFIKKDFPGICGVLQDKEQPWTELVESFPEGKMVCPFKPMDEAINNVTFNGDVSKVLDLGEDDVGLYRLQITGVGSVDMRKETPLGCLSGKFTIEGFDE